MTATHELTSKAKAVYEVIKEAVESGSETPARRYIAKRLGYYPSSVQRAMSELLHWGFVIKHGGGYTTTYTIPGVDGQTRRRHPGEDWCLDSFEIFDHERANRRFVAALRAYFDRRNRENWK